MMGVLFHLMRHFPGYPSSIASRLASKRRKKTGCFGRCEGHKNCELPKTSSSRWWFQRFFIFIPLIFFELGWNLCFFLRVMQGVKPWGPAGFTLPTPFRWRSPGVELSKLFGSLEEWLKVHPEVGRTEKGIQGISNGTRRESWKNINFCEICIILYRFLFCFFIWYNVLYTYLYFGKWKK